MESTDSDGEDGCAALRQNQMDRRVREENFYEFVSNLSEDDYELMRDHDLLGIPGESTLEELLERFQEIKENSPAYSEENTGGEESSTTSGEDPLDFLNPFGQTEDATSGQRENQTWEETRQINSDSNDSTFRLPVNSKPNNGSPNPENEYVASTRYPRAYKMKNSQSPAEKIQSESKFIGSPGSEQITTEALLHGPVTTGQRRARSRSPADQGTTARTDSPAPNRTNERLQRFHSRLRYPTFEPLVKETENFPSIPHQETSRQPITGLELPNRGLAAASGTRGALEEESSPDTTNDGESWRRGPSNPTKPPNPEVGQVCPRAYSERDSRALVPDLRIEIPNDTVTLESEQGGLGQEGRAENIQSESTFIGSPASERSTTEALIHGPVTTGQRRPRSRSPDDRGTRISTERPAPNIIHELLERFHYTLRNQILESMGNETENFPRVPHQETSRQQITGLELQTRGLAAASGTSGALAEESSPETPSDGESWSLGLRNPTTPPNPDVGQVCPRAHCQRDSIARRFQLTCQIPNDTVTLESEEGGLGHTFPHSEQTHVRACNSENNQSPAKNIESESTFIGSPGSEQSTTVALLHGPVTRSQRRARSRSPADRGIRARTESPAPNRTNERLQRFHSRLRYPTFEPLVKETENFPRILHQETSRQQTTGLERQNRGLASHSGTRGALDEESSPETTSDGESWRRGQSNPTIPPNPEVGQVCPRAHSQRHSIAPRIQLTCEIPNDTVTLESDQSGLGHESRAENIQSESKFIGSLGSEQRTTKALLHGPVTRGQRRARSRSPADRGTRARTESPAPNRTNQRLQRFHSRIRYPTFEPLVKETENFPRFPHQETSRQQITGLELQNRGLVSDSGTNSALEESSPESTSNGESWRPGQMNPTIPPNREVGQVCPRVHSQRDSIVPRFDLRIEIPNDTVTLEREQGGLGQESQAENLQTKSTFIKSPGSEQKTTKALLHGPVTRGQRRARSRSPADRGTRARTESPAPNRTNQRLQRFHSRIRYPTFEPLVKETENFPRFPHQETSRQEITGLELQNRGLVSDSGTNSALEESSPESTSDGESWRPGQMNPTIPPNREVGQVCPRVHSQRDSIVPRFDLRIEIPNDTVTLEREQGGLGQESRAENLQTESTFIKSPGSEQKTTKALLHGPVTRGQRRPRSRSPADRGTRARTESPAPNRTNQRLQRFHSRIRYPTFEPLVKETENFPRFPHQETSRQQITGLELQNRGLVSDSGTNSALEESSPESTSDGESWRPGQMNPTIPPNREVGQVCPRVHSQRDSIVPRFDLRIEIPNDTVTLEREQGGLGQESRAENLQTDSTFIKSPGSEQRTTKALLHGPVTRGQQRARSRSPADRGTRARTESPAPNRNNERFQRFHSRIRYPTSEPLVKETENFPRIPHQETSRQQTTGLELQNRGLAAASGTSGAPAEESSPETTSVGESWRRGQSNPTKPPNPEVGQVSSRAQSQTHSIAKRCQLMFRIPNDSVKAGTEEGGLGDTFPHCEQPDARAYNSENSQSPTENIEPKSTFIGSPGSDQSTTEALIHGPVTTAQRRARSRSPDHPRTRARTESLDPNKTNERLQRFQTRLRYPTFEPLAKENESFPTFLHQETSRQQITGLELPNRGLAAASGTSGAPAEERSPETTSDGESWRRGQSNPTIPPNPEVGQVCPRAQSQTHSIANRCQLTCEIPNDAVTVESEQGALGDTFPRSEQPGARAYNSENSQSPAENIESESTFIGSPGSEQSPAWNAGSPSLHILWSTGFDDIPSPPIQSPLRHTVTGSSDLSDSDLSDSDTDLVHSVSSLSSDMESEGSISETDASDATTPSVLNSYPSCDSSSTSTSISSSGSNYIIISSSSPIPSSSSSAEDSEGNSVIFVGSSNTRSSPGSLSETRHENRSLSPITFDYGDSWDQFYPVIYDSDDQWAGLPTVQIDNLPIRSYAEGDALQSCAICITEYTEGNRVRILPCTHQFHVDCVDRWLSENSTCPICRTEVAYSAQRQNSD